jgi:putative addiction module CopG family antidote
MSLDLSPNIESMINNKVQSGLYASANDVIIDALTLLDRQLAQKMQIEKLLDDGESSLNAGRSFSPDEVKSHMKRIFENIENAKK